MKINKKSICILLIMCMLFIFCNIVQAVEIQYITAEEAIELLEAREQGETLSTKNIADIYNAMQKNPNNKKLNKYGNQIADEMEELEDQGLVKFLDDGAVIYAYVEEVPDIKIDSNSTDSQILSDANTIVEFLKGRDGTISKENIPNIDSAKKKNYMEVLSKAYTINTKKTIYADAYIALGGDLDDLETEPQKPSGVASGTIIPGTKGDSSGTDYEDGNPMDNPDYYDPSTGEQIETGAIIKITGIIASALQIIGTIIAIFVIMILGMKYIMGSASEKAEYKKTMIPYLIGVIILVAGGTFLKILYSLIVGTGINN